MLSDNVQGVRSFHTESVARQIAAWVPSHTVQRISEVDTNARGRTGAHCQHEAIVRTERILTPLRCFSRVEKLPNELIHGRGKRANVFAGQLNGSLHLYVRA